jgi:hypothetical protein
LDDLMVIAPVVSRIATRFPNWLRDNTFARTELAYQRRRGKIRRWREWLAFPLRYFGLMLGLILAGGVFVGSLLQRDTYPIGLALRDLPTLFIITLTLAHFVVQFRTIVLATHSLAREREGNTWELVVMTGISSADVIRGKWWAVVQQQLPTYLWLGALRACAIIWFGYAQSTLTRTFIGYYWYEPPTAIILSHPLILLYTFAGIMLLTLLNLGFTAACGLAGAALMEKSSTALARGIAMRLLLGLLPLVVVALNFGMIAFVFSELSIIIPESLQGIVTSFVNMILGLVVSVIDNGATMGSQLSQVRFLYATSTYQVGILDGQVMAFFTFITTAAFMVWYMRLALRWAERRLQKSGTL